MSIRLTYFVGLLAICFILLISVYLQVYDGFIPCPLCTLQRLVFIWLGILFFLGFLFHSKRWIRLLIDSLAGISAIIGICLAGRQIWLQRFPTGDNNECGVSLEYMAHVLPLNQLVQKILEGSTECAKRGWEFLHLNMPEWSIVWFVMFLLLILYLVLKEITLSLHKGKHYKKHAYDYRKTQ